MPVLKFIFDVISAKTQISKIAIIPRSPYHQKEGIRHTGIETMADLSSSKFGKGVEELSSSSLGDGTRANAMHESETKRRRVSGGTQEAPPSGLGEIEEGKRYLRNLK